MTPADASIYTDFQGLAQLKAQARQDQSSSLDQVARQFESILTQMMIRSMREANLGGSELESDQSLFYRDMYDQQLALHLSQGSGLGLADVIKRQLSPDNDHTLPKGQAIEVYRQSSTYRVPDRGVEPSQLIAEKLDIDGPESFVRQLWPEAEQAAAELGLPAEALLAQAALESGWGQRMIQHTDGANSHNLFGIKADHRWDGERVAVSTLEFEQGIAVRKKAYFRAYSSFGESFSDYVDFIKSGSRYQAARQSVDQPDRYFSQLQHAGYATDPAYAEKVMRVLQGPEMSDALRQLKDEVEQPIQI